MALVARVTAPVASHKPGKCEVTLAERALTAPVATLEFGDVFSDAAGTRSVSEFEVTLFSVANSARESRIRVRMQHSYEGGTMALRDRWFEPLPGADEVIVLRPCDPAPLAALEARSRAFWQRSMGDRDPAVE